MGNSDRWSDQAHVSFPETAFTAIREFSYYSRPLADFGPETTFTLPSGMLQMQRVICSAVLFTMLCGFSLQALSADPAPSTVMTVGEMCGGCVRKITARLEKLPGVAEINCDVKTKSVTVTHATDKPLTARVLWVAMEEIGKTPKKLVGPEGTFTAKPKL